MKRLFAREGLRVDVLATAQRDNQSSSAIGALPVTFQNPAERLRLECLLLFEECYAIFDFGHGGLPYGGFWH